MNEASMGAIMMAGGKELFASPHTRSALRRFFHWLKKKMLRNAHAVIAEDFSLNHLSGKLKVDQKYKVIHLEKILATMNSDMMKSSSMQLKRLDYHVWIVNNTEKLKALLNSVRWSFEDRSVIVVLSSVKLAQLLHIKPKNTYVYQMAQGMFEEVMSDDCIDEQNKEYMKERRYDNSYDDSIEYESFEQLQRLIENKFK